MKRQIVRYLLLILLLYSSISYISESQYSLPRTEKIISVSPRDSSLLDLPFNSSALNWSFQVAYTWTDDPADFWYYYHFNISCTLIQSLESLIFNFTYRLQIDHEKNEELPVSYTLLDAAFVFDPFWYLKVDLYHENSVDVCYLYLSNPLNDSKSGSYEQSLAVIQEEAPLGYYYTSVISGKSSTRYHSRGERIYINKSELSSYYDSDALWVKDLSNFSFATNFHMKDFEFSHQFLGSYNAFLGDGIHHANSTINMKYLQNVSRDPLIITDFNVSLSSRSTFVNIYDSYTMGEILEFLPDVVLNQTHFQNSSYQEIEYISTNSMEGIWFVINDTISPGVFNATYLEQDFVFQLNTLPTDSNLIFELEIRQMVPEEPEPEQDPESISGFSFPFLVSGIFIAIGVVGPKRRRRMIKEK